MKKNLLLIFLSISLFSQDISGIGQQDQNYLQGGLGYSWINGEPYLTFTLSPELSFGKIGVGLNIELMFSQNNDLKFRKDMYEGGA
ncbi:MAG: hypothetical protein KDD94_10050, partial [Calditrichaeota bacterium]|nr:hypothetical protein [Calditrichota bacterium]